MSSGSDDVVNALKVLLKALGAEASRGLIYWATFKGADALSAQIANLVQKVMSGQNPSQQEIEQLKQYLLQRQLTAQPDPDQLARMLAPLVLQYMQGSSAYSPQTGYTQRPYQPPQTYSQQPYPPAQPGYPQQAYVEERQRILREDLDRYRRILADLEQKYYAELDETKRQEYRKRMDEVREKINEIMAKLAAPTY